MTSRHDEGGDPVGELIENSGYINGMVTGWTLFVTFLNADGESLISTDTMEGQVTTTTMGHAQAIVAIESARIVQMFTEDDV